MHPAVQRPQGPPGVFPSIRPAVDGLHVERIGLPNVFHRLVVKLRRGCGGDVEAALSFLDARGVMVGRHSDKWRNMSANWARADALQGADALAVIRILILAIGGDELIFSRSTAHKVLRGCETLLHKAALGRLLYRNEAQQRELDAANVAFRKIMLIVFADLSPSDFKFPNFHLPVHLTGLAPYAPPPPHPPFPLPFRLYVLFLSLPVMLFCCLPLSPICRELGTSLATSVESSERAHQYHIKRPRSNCKGPGSGLEVLLEQAARALRFQALRERQAEPVRAPAGGASGSGYERGLRGKMGRLDTADGLAGLLPSEVDFLQPAWASLHPGSPAFDPALAVRFQEAYIQRPGEPAIRMRATPSFHSRPRVDSGLVLEADDDDEPVVPGLGDPDKVNVVLFVAFFFYTALAGGGSSDSDSAAGSDAGSVEFAPDMCYAAYFKYAHATSADKTRLGLSFIVPRRVDRTTLIIEPISALYDKVDVLPWFRGTKDDPTRRVDGGLVSHLLTG